MRLLTFALVIIYCTVIVAVLALFIIHAESVAHALTALHLRARASLSALIGWAPACGFAFGIGLIEGFFWRRRQVFAGFYQTVFVSSVLIVFLIMLTTLLLPMVGPETPVLLTLVGLSGCLGLTLLAGRPLVR